MLKSFGVITALAVAVAGAGASVAVAQADTSYGGGGLPDRAKAPTFTRYLDSWGVGLRRSADGGTVGLRVTFSLRCARPGGTGWRSTDAVVRGTVAADGTFHIRGARAKTSEMGTVRVTADGTFAAAGRADGTVSVSTSLGCGLSKRPFTTRQVDLAAPAANAAPAPVDGLLYGITDEGGASAVPHPVVVKVEDGATTAHAYMSYGLRCRGRDRHGPYDTRITFQTLLAEAPIAGGAWTTAKATKETKHVRRDAVWRGTFDGAALRGSFHDTRRVVDPRQPERCAAGTHGFVVLP
ncbi:hypothetical protein [Baekduia sp. Peel2402]|uniref:hypothetical protein n=1 Tax=Baekduia sp. Peel2402 TaxID=3458296 RepID=UPI00403ED8B6